MLFSCIFVSTLYLEYPLEYNHDTSQLCRTGHDDMSRTRMTTSLSYFLSYFPLIISDAISCALHNLNTLWYIIMIFHSYVEQVLTMCRVQERQFSLSYFLSYFPLIVSDAISCPLCNLITLWYIIMTLYSYVEQVLTMCCIQE